MENRRSKEIVTEKDMKPQNALFTMKTSNNAAFMADVEDTCSQKSEISSLINGSKEIVSGLDTKPLNFTMKKSNAAFGLKEIVAGLDKFPHNITKNNSKSESMAVFEDTCSLTLKNTEIPSLTSDAKAHKAVVAPSPRRIVKPQRTKRPKRKKKPPPPPPPEEDDGDSDDYSWEDKPGLLPEPHRKYCFIL